MIWISKKLANKISKMEILPKASFDHNPINLMPKRKSTIFKWRVNEGLLQKDLVMDNCRKN